MPPASQDWYSNNSNNNNREHVPIRERNGTETTQKQQTQGGKNGARWRKENLCLPGGDVPKRVNMIRVGVGEALCTGTIHNRFLPFQLGNTQPGG